MTRLHILAIDTETSGMGPEADVIEFGMSDVHGEATEWRAYSAAAHLFGTDKPIEPGASAAHHLIKDDLINLRTFAERAPGLIAGNYGAASEITAIAAHNAEFDRPRVEHLFPGRPWICTYKCSLRAFPDAPSHANAALHYWLRDQALWPAWFNRNLASPPHRAGPDAYVTGTLLTVLLRLHTLADLLQWSAEPRFLTKMPVGEHKGKRFEEVPHTYLFWMLKQNFEAEVVAAVKRELDRRSGAKP